MNEESEEALTDKERLLFGAGFVFGVMFTMLILAVIIATVGGNTGTGVEATNVFVTVAAGIFFAGVVGAALYLLAFPENRVKIPIGSRVTDTAVASGDQPGDDDQRDEV